MATDPHWQASPGAPEGAMAYIKRVREQLGIKQRAIADALGMLPGQYSGMENNRSPGYLPRPDQLAVICGILRITQVEVVRAAGYLSDSSAARRLDDDSDNFLKRQDEIAAAFGAALERHVGQLTRDVVDEVFPPKRDADRQSTSGGL